MNEKQKPKPASDVVTPAEMGKPESGKVGDRQEANGAKEAVPNTPQDLAGAPGPQEKSPADKSKPPSFWCRLFSWWPWKKKPDADEAAQRAEKQPAGRPAVAHSNTAPQPKPPSAKTEEELSPEACDALGLAVVEVDALASAGVHPTLGAPSDADGKPGAPGEAQPPVPESKGAETKPAAPSPVKEELPVAEVKAPDDAKGETAVLEKDAPQKKTDEKTPEPGEAEAVPQPTKTDLSRKVEDLQIQLDKTSKLTDQAHSSCQLQNQFSDDFKNHLEELRGKISQLAGQVRTLQQETLDVRSLAEQFRSCGQGIQKLLSLCGGSQNPSSTGGCPSLVPAEVGAAATVVAKLREEACGKETEGLANDRKELDGHLQQIGYWRERVIALREGLTSSCESFSDLTTQAATKADSLLEHVPPEFQEGLKGSQKGMDVTAKMMRLGTERAEAALTTGDEPSTEMPVLGEEGWRGLVDGKTDRNAAIQTFQRKLKELERNRFQVMTQIRTTGEKYCKSFRNLSEKHILPILDSIDDGEEHSRSLVEQIKTGNPKIAEDLDAWFQTYGNLRRQILDVFDQVGIRPMEVEIGGPIDYHRHEPFDFEADPEVKDEHIKSVTRKGYEYQAREGDEFLVLRHAQVIVVKNKKEQKVPNDAS
ncbi:MAG: nucleotide exchange factor GrpE [Phycisphaerae bacterium]|nr:nucleotide exchange factor GrpE [Phycisphaerae bacterium]